MHELLSMAAVDLAAQVRAGIVSPVDVVRAHIARIEEVNPRLNAVVAHRFEQALAEAATQERLCARRGGGELPPLVGVPFTVKELVAVRGMPFTAGVVARRGLLADDDAPAVARLRAAGGIPLGVTNVSEAGLWLESHNRLYGRTENPHAPGHIAGGSSGGEGAILAAGGSALGVGADIGGSIRNPCFFNGVPGHKPSGGLVPSAGHFPPAEGERGRYCVIGPMGRRVRDLSAAMEVLAPAGDPHRDAGRPHFRPLRDLDPREVTVHWYESDGLTEVDPEVGRAVREAVYALGRAGFHVAPFRPDGLERAPEIWTALVSRSDETSVRALLGDGAPIDLVRQWAALLRGRGDHALTSLVMATLEAVARAGEGRARALADLRDALRARIEGRLGPRGVLVCPPYPRPAPRHHAPLALPLAFAYCGLFNVLELPATAVPTAASRGGLPLGVQIVGRRHADALTLFVAEHLERAVGPFRPARVRGATGARDLVGSRR